MPSNLQLDCATYAYSVYYLLCTYYIYLLLYLYVFSIEGSEG